MSIFNCTNCTKPYNKITKKPKSLPCGHVFCEECVSSFIYKDLKGINCKCPIDKLIHKNLTLFKIPFCVQILNNIPESKNEFEKEKKDFFCNIEIIIKNIFNQFDLYEIKEKEIIIFYDEQRKKINDFFQKLIEEIEIKKKSFIENINLFFKKQSLKIDNNKSLIKNYYLKLNDMIKNNQSIFQIKEYEQFIKEKKKIEKELNNINSFIEKNIKNEIDEFLYFNEPIFSIKNNLGELKIINKIKNEKELNEKKLNEDSEIDFGNITNIFNHNLYNEIKNLKTPPKDNKIYYLSENSIMNNNNFNKEYSLNELNFSEKISKRKKKVKYKKNKEKSISNFSLPKNHFKNKSNIENNNINIKINSFSKEKRNKNKNEISLIGNNFRLYKDNNNKNEKYKKEFITIENSNKNIKKIIIKDSQKLFISKSILNIKNSLTRNHNLNLLSSRGNKNYNSQLYEEIS